MGGWGPIIPCSGSPARTEATFSRLRLVRNSRGTIGPQPSSRCRPPCCRTSARGWPRRVRAVGVGLPAVLAEGSRCRRPLASWLEARTVLLARRRRLVASGSCGTHVEPRCQGPRVAVVAGRLRTRLPQPSCLRFLSSWLLSGGGGAAAPGLADGPGGRSRGRGGRLNCGARVQMRGGFVPPAEQFQESRRLVPAGGLILSDGAPCRPGAAGATTRHGLGGLTCRTRTPGA